MVRKFFSYGLLAVTIFWLVANYIPESVLPLPKVSLAGVLPSTVQQVIFAVLMILFVIIQISLVFSTNRLFKLGPNSAQPLSNSSAQLQANGSDLMLERFGLKRGPELFWTSVPLLMTLVTLYLTYTIFT